MIHLYNTVIQIILWGIKHLPEQHRYRRWIALRDEQDQGKSETTESILFACASVGEYESIRVIVQQLRAHGERIHLMFFSDSGYDYAQTHADYDVLSYSPIDTPWEVNQYLRRYPTKAVIISGNYYWPIFLRELRWHDIPYYYLDVRLHLQRSKATYNYWIKKQLRQSSLVSSYCPRTIKALKRSGIEVMDTAPLRLASLYEMLNIELPSRLDDFIKKANTLIIYGSTHPEDIDILHHVTLPDDHSLIIAPHHIDEQSILSVKESYPTATRLSEASALITSQILILDSIGLLKHLYQYADKAYVGGGFEQGIHSILEPAVHGIPIAFGPVHGKFPEAEVLINSEQATEVNNSESIQAWLSHDDRQYQMPKNWNREALDNTLDRIVSHILTRS